MYLQANKEDAEAKDMAMLMFETATLRSGFVVQDSAAFAARVERMLKAAHDIPLDAAVRHFMYM